MYKNDKNAKYGKSTDKSGKNSYRGRRGNSRDKENPRGSKEDRYDSEKVKGKTEARNDSSWYGGNSILMNQAAKVSFGNALGMDTTISPFKGLKPFRTGTYHAPGIMSISMIATPGVAENWNDPINIAARQLYTYVRHVNSGHSNYDANDLMMYILCMDSLYTYYAWMVRMYGTMRTVMLRNRYLPEGIVIAQGGNYDALADDMANFLYYINLFAARINSMCVPDSFNIFKRHMWMFSNIYADKPIDKCQMYVTRPTFFWRYDPTHDSQVPCLVPLYVTPDSEWAKGVDFARIKEIGDSLLDTVLQNEDFNIMSGDILKAYGSAIFRVNPIDMAYSVSPTYEPEFLVQIHNASVHEINEDNLSTFVITQDLAEDSPNLGCIIFQPVWKHDLSQAGAGDWRLAFPEARAAAYDHLIDVPVDDPTPEHIAIASRFKTDVNVTLEKEGAAQVFKCSLVSGGSELITSVRIMTKTDSVEQNPSHIWNGFEFSRYYPANNGNYQNVTGNTTGQTFSGRPILYLTDINGDQTDPAVGFTGRAGGGR